MDHQCYRRCHQHYHSECLGFVEVSSMAHRPSLGNAVVKEKDVVQVLVVEIKKIAFVLVR